MIGSGSAVHNLGALAREGTEPPFWAKSFDAWLASVLQSRDLEQLIAFSSAGPHARMAHPTAEHLLPLFVAAGAGWEAGNTSKLYGGWSYGSLSMAAYAFGGEEVSQIGGSIAVRTPSPEQPQV